MDETTNLNINKPLPSLPELSQEQIYNNRPISIIRLRHVIRPVELYSIIDEESSVLLNTNLNSSTSTLLSTSSSSSTIFDRDPYTFSDSYEFRSEILHLLTESERAEMNLLNNNNNNNSNSTLGLTRLNSSETLVDNNNNVIENEPLLTAVEIDTLERLTYQRLAADRLTPTELPNRINTIDRSTFGNID
jgi:hypothetical protein